MTNRDLKPIPVPPVHEDYEDCNCEQVGYAEGWNAALQAALASPAGEAVRPAEAQVDEIVTQLYRRFKDWSKRGFGPDDVTWCEVKADVIALLKARPAPAAEQTVEPMHPSLIRVLRRNVERNCGVRIGGLLEQLIAQAQPAPATEPPLRWPGCIYTHTASGTGGFVLTVALRSLAELHDAHRFIVHHDQLVKAPVAQSQEGE